MAGNSHNFEMMAKEAKLFRVAMIRHAPFRTACDFYYSNIPQFLED